VGRSSAAFRLVSSVVELENAGGRAGGRGICDSHGRDSGSIMVLLRNYWPDVYGRAAADGGSWAIKGDAQRVYRCQPGHTSPTLVTSGSSQSTAARPMLSPMEPTHIAL